MGRDTRRSLFWVMSLASEPRGSTACFTLDVWAGGLAEVLVGESAAAASAWGYASDVEVGFVDADGVERLGSLSWHWGKPSERRSWSPLPKRGSSWAYRSGVRECRYRVGP